MKKIEAKMIADSISPQGNRIISYLLTYPRFIHSELMTHRMFSRNSASSRAIPFEKMVKMVEEDPFIPIAWQKDHKGMQGTEYFDPNQSFRVEDFLESLKTLSDKIDVTLYHKIIGKYSDLSMTLPAWWLFTRDKVLEASILLNVFGVTKQICNRLLEPFMWHTVLVTATEYDNFFNLRCPKYEWRGQYYKSIKDIRKNVGEDSWFGMNQNYSINNRMWWLQYHNTSQAEIHIQALAEAMWDVYNESTPKELKAGEWHIPFGDNILNLLPEHIWKHAVNDDGKIIDTPLINAHVKISTARCARLSYMTFDGEIDYEKDINLHNHLLKSHHMSPFEHCARAMTDEEYYSFVKGKEIIEYFEEEPNIYTFEDSSCGWCNNFRGFIQYRYLIENNKK